MDSIFRAGGLASGLDTNAIIEKFTELESRPLDILRRRKSALEAQVSIIGDISSKLSALKSAAEKLSSNGVLGVKATSTNTSFTATPGTTAGSGRYDVKVEAMAVAAKSRSQGFTSPSAQVRGGVLHIDVNSVGYDILIADGTALSDVAFAINQSDAPVTATVATDSTATYLTIANKNTGHPIGSPPSSGLWFSEITTGTKGQALSISTVNEAANAKVEVDGLVFERQSNIIADVIPGTSLTLKATGAAEVLTLSEDAELTQANLQSFVDAYNDVLKLVQQQLAIGQETDRQYTLAGDQAIRGLQRQLQGLTSSELAGGDEVRALADLGVKTARDGTLSIDTTTLNSVLTEDPAAVNALFSTAETGIGALAEALVDRHTRKVGTGEDDLEGLGVLVSRTRGLNDNIDAMDDQMERMQLRVDMYRKKLVAQFTAMEKIVSSLQSTGSFLDQQMAIWANQDGK